MINFENQNKESHEVYLSTEKTISLSSEEILKIKQLAYNNSRKRIRFCSHSSPDEYVHEMFIVHPEGAYIRPHMHKNKSESMLVLEGEVDYIIFDNSGNINDVIPMGHYPSGKCFYQSIRTDLYHTLLIRSEWLVFLEITKGPFKKEDTVMATWSPHEKDIQEVQQYINNLERSVIK